MSDFCRLSARIFPTKPALFLMQFWPFPYRWSNQVTPNYSHLSAAARCDCSIPMCPVRLPSLTKAWSQQKAIKHPQIRPEQMTGLLLWAQGLQHTQWMYPRHADRNTCYVARCFAAPERHSFSLKFRWQIKNPLDLLPETKTKVCNKRSQSQQLGEKMAGKEINLCQSGLGYTDVSSPDGEANRASGAWGS